MADSQASPSAHYEEQSTLSSEAVVHKWRIGSPRAIVILQHGFGEYAARYVKSHSELIPKLNKRGLEVWAMDLWGHGDSPGCRGMVHVQKAIHDHVELRSQAAEQKLPVFLFGHSLGGLVTASSVLHDAPEIKGVVLTSPALPESKGAIIDSSVNLIAWLMPELSVPQDRSAINTLFRDTRQISIAETDDSLFKGRMSFLLAATALQTNVMTAEKLSGWNVPTLVVHGTSDASVNFEVSRRFVDMVASADKTLHVVEGGYHELLNDNDSELTVQLILNWLDSRL